MRVIKDRPPNFAAILKVFPKASMPGVIFAYNDAIYVPSGNDLPLELIAHEMVHLARQKEHIGGAEGWWDDYLVSVNFRFMEELLAHRAEYQSLIARAMNRKARKMALLHVAQKLAAPLYGNMVSVKQAKAWLTEDVNGQPAG